MKILMIDNYDSFTYNLVHILQTLVGFDSVKVVRNDEINMSDVNNFDKIILSPGPGIPSESGQLLEVIKNYIQLKPMLGVCLGHQAIAEFCGARLFNLETVYHGIATPINILKEGELFSGIENGILVGRYHSWAVDQLPTILEATSEDNQGIIMSFRHREYPVYGVQFHPESILTPIGPRIIENWLNL